jgi:hypothetical protein
MFNKRGLGNDIDWILGVGIFLMSLTLIFVIFRPGIKPVTDSETLLNILQAGLEDLDWEVSKTPIFVYSTKNAGTNPVLLSNSKCTGTCSTGQNKISTLINGKEKLNIQIIYVEDASGDPGNAASDSSSAEVDSSCQRAGRSSGR